MNFLETYDTTRSSTPNSTQAETTVQPSLNEEVNQVLGHLGRFWGGFRKQSQTALETARKDLTQVVAQAQKEISKFTSADPAQGTETTTANDCESEQEQPIASTSTNLDEGVSSTSSSQTLFSRLQSALPPNLVTTVQDNIPESLKHASENIDIQQIRSNLFSEFQRVQGVTLAQAEEYAHRSEALLREAVKEAGEVLRDAVKVLPPDEASSNEGSGLVWDGSDMWMLPFDGNEPTSSGKEKEGSTSVKRRETRNAVASRAEELLRRLKRDPTILRRDPEVDDAIKDQYRTWRTNKVDQFDNGIEAVEWKTKINDALDDPIDGQALKELQGTLVPSEMSDSVFWLRFFFRCHQIRVEEEKRKSLINSSAENDEDFSWEDEDEEETSPANNKSVQPAEGASRSTTTLSLKNITDSLSPVGTGATPSPSEDSFDLISSGNASVVGDEKPGVEKSFKKKAEEDEGESDWE